MRTEVEALRYYGRTIRAQTGLLAILLAACAHAYALDGVINVKLPYGIGQELAPIQIELGVKGAAQGEVALTYHIYDIYKHEAAKATLSLRAQNGNAGQVISFTPPKWGWYAVQLYPAGSTNGWEKHFGVSPKFPGMHTLAQGELRSGWNDEALQAFSGLLLDRTNTRMGHGNAERVIGDCQKYGVTLLMQFESKPSVDHVKEWVTKYKGRVKYWEVVNEPNFSMNPQQFAELVKTVYPVIKSIDSQAVVMGPCVCGIDLGWYSAFYKAGGGPFVDAISIHDYEGHGGIDIFFWDYKMSGLRKIMAQYGDANKPIWQTERAIGGVYSGFVGTTQGIRMTLQRDILETYGVTNNHNNHYYAAVTGYSQVPTFIISDSGPHASVFMCRTRAAMQAGRKFVEKLDFGPTGNKIFLGLRYQGNDGSSIMLRNFGCLDLPLDVDVKGGEMLEVVDSFGNTQKVPVKDGKASLLVTQVPIYVRLAKEQELKIPKWDFGRNIAPEAKFSYTGAPKIDSKPLTDGVFQSYYPSDPWHEKYWRYSYAGKTFNDKPETLEIDFGTPRQIQKLLIYGVRSDNPYSAILDYDLQYENGGQWVTLEEVRTPCPPSDLVKSFMCKSSMWYLDNNFFVHQFKKPVNTSKLRMIVRRITRGCIADMTAEDAINVGLPKHWQASAQLLELREFEIYGPASGMESK